MTIKRKTRIYESRLINVTVFFFSIARDYTQGLAHTSPVFRQPGKRAEASWRLSRVGEEKNMCTAYRACASVYNVLLNAETWDNHDLRHILSRKV